MNPRERVLVDTNVPMYAAGRDHALRLACQRVLTRMVAGELDAVTNVEVHQEILHRYLSLGMAAKGREVSEDFQTAIPSVLPVTVDDVVRARGLSTSYPALSARDLLHVAVMLNNGIETIVSADRDFDRVAEITRLDPAEVGRPAG